MSRRDQSLGRSIARVLIASAAGAGWAGLAVAQERSTDSATDAEARDGAVMLLEEIVVTGTNQDAIQVGSFRGASVLETPLSVTVISRDLLDAQQALNLGDVMRNTPGVSFSQVSPVVSTNLSIRGIPVENRSNYRLNGGLPIVNLIDMPIEAFERVEVLKGVSSLYYGFVTPAGIVNMIAKRPEPNGNLAVNLFGNSGGGYGGHADMGMMNESGTLGFRVNAVAADVDYGVDRTDGKRQAATAAVDIKPTEDMRLLFDGQYIHKDITEPALFQLTPVGGVFTLPPLLDLAKNFSSPWMKADADQYNLAAHFDWRFAENWDVLVEAGISNVTRDRRLGLIRNVNPVTGAAQMRLILTNELMFENRNYRVELAHGFETGPLRHQLTIGATHNERIAESSQTQTLPDRPFNIYTRPLLAEAPLPPRVVPNPGEITDRGYYAFDRVSYGDVVDVLLGVRRAEYENVSRTGVPVDVQVTTFSPGLVIKPTAQLSLYATYIEGLEETPPAPQIAVNSGEILPPSESEQKEVGVKWEPKNGLLFTTSYFHIDRASAFTNAANRFVLDGRTVYQGIETSLQGPLTESIYVGVSGTWLDAEQRNAAQASVIGKTPENTPEYAASAFAEVNLPWVAGLAVNAGATYTAKRAINPNNDAFIPGYTLFNLGATYKTNIGDTTVALRLSGENIGQKKYFAATGANLLAYGQPRLIKLSVGVEL